MLKRTISGGVYLAILTAFFLMREFVDYRIFHILTYFFMIAGTIELVRMLKPFSVKWIGVFALCYSIIFAPSYLIAKNTFLKNNAFLFSINVALICIIVVLTYALSVKIEGKKVIYLILPFIYPSLCLLFMLLANEMIDYGFIVLITAFAISPLSDTFAYLVGRLIGGKKLCPKISPKKTWAGAIGGTIFGAIGGILVYLIFKPSINFFSPILFFGILGFVASIVNIFGDLIESLIKRKVGVKDSGKIMPGHGGVLDRIDGTMLTILPVYFAFLLV